MTAKRRISDTSDKENSQGNLNENAPTVNKPKSSSTDLTILLGEEKFEYHCHSVIMADSSDFIAAALKQTTNESKNQTIVLSDIPPRIWSLMMYLLESPTLPKGIGMTEMILAAHMFHKYQFGMGCTFSDAHIARQFQCNYKMLDESEPQLANYWSMDDLVRLSLECYKIPMKITKSVIVGILRRILTLPLESGNHYGGLILTVEQIKLLAPLIAAENLLGDQWTKEEILCPLFPKHFLATVSREYEEKRIGQVIMPNVVLQLARAGFKPFTLTTLKNVARNQMETPVFIGNVHQCNAHMWGQELQNGPLLLVKPGRADDWVIAARSGYNAGENGFRILWQSPMSMNCTKAPPMKPWVRINNGAPHGALVVVPWEPTWDPLRAGMEGTSGGLPRKQVSVLAGPP